MQPVTLIPAHQGGGSPRS